MDTDQGTFVVTKRNGKAFCAVWFVRPRSLVLEDHVASWPIDMTREQLNTFTIEDLKKLYADRLAKAQEKIDAG